MPLIIWDEGTAYDFFVSLYVLHRPADFGLRLSWAAGVRSRMPATQRDFLEKSQSFLPVPISWLYLLPAEAKTVAGALNALAQLPAAERLPSLLFDADTSIEAIHTLESIPLRQTWSSAEQEVLRAALSRRGIHPRPSTIQHLCAAWTDLTAFGEQYLQVLTTYQQVFFYEEEEHIRPLLHQARQQAEELAGQMSQEELLAELSNGIHFENTAQAKKIILAPSYWASPLSFYRRVEPDHLMVLFGCRPPTVGLVPGETIPHDLLEALKAMADPSRLHILRYLSETPQTPSQLARRMRLRPPTVIHHLNVLRLAGLVEVTLNPEEERGYSLRREALEHAVASLGSFLNSPPSTP